MTASIEAFRLHPGLFALSALFVGAVVGSFLNVVIFRLPVMLSRDWQREAKVLLALPAVSKGDLPETYNLCWPGSACPFCAKPIRMRDNIPVLSWLLLRGRCRHCRSRIRIRYPLVEALTALLTFWVAVVFGPSPDALWGFLLTWALVVLVFIDLDHRLLPDAITIPLLWTGLAGNLFGVFVPVHDAVLGAMAGYGTLWGVYQIHRRIRGRAGMGHGDFKLFAAIGAWLGYLMLFPTLMIACVLVIGGAMVLRVFSGQLPDQLPFGPALAAGGFICLLYGHEVLMAWTVRVFSIHTFG